jgi:hypothetical protein
MNRLKADALQTILAMRRRGKRQYYASCQNLFWYLATASKRLRTCILLQMPLT